MEYEKERTEVVTTGAWQSRKFDGIVVDGIYYDKGAARNAKETHIRAEYWRARHAWRTGSYSLHDAPLKQYTENGTTIYHHDLKERDE